MSASGTPCYQPALSPDSVDGAPPTTVNVVAVARRSTTSQPCMADTASASEEAPTSLVHSTQYAPVHKIMSRQQTRSAPTSAGRKVNSPYGLPMQPRVDLSDSSRAPMAVCEPEGSGEELAACPDDRYHQIRQKIFDECDGLSEGQRLGTTELPPSGDDGTVGEEPTTIASAGTSSAATQNGASRAPLVGGNGRRPKYALRGPSGNDDGHDIFRRNHVPFGGAPHQRGGGASYRGGPGGGSYNAPHSHHQHQQHHHHNHHQAALHHHHLHDYHHHHHSSLASLELTAGAMGVNGIAGYSGWSGGPPGAHLHPQSHHHHHPHSYMPPPTPASYPFDGQISGPASSSEAYSDTSSADYLAFQRQSERGRHNSYPMAPPAPWMPPGGLPLPALRGGGMPSVHVGMYPPPLPPPPQQSGFGFQGGLDGGYPGPSYPPPFVPPQGASHQHAGIHFHHHHHHNMNFPLGPHQHQSTLSYAAPQHHSQSFSHQTPQFNNRRPQPLGPPRPNHSFHHHHHHHVDDHHHYDGEAYQRRQTSVTDADVSVATSYRETGALRQHSQLPGVVDTEGQSCESPPSAS